MLSLKVHRAATVHENVPVAQYAVTIPPLVSYPEDEADLVPVEGAW